MSPKRQEDGNEFQSMSSSRLSRRLERVENKMTPPVRETTTVVIHYVSPETKSIVATQVIEGGVIGPVADVRATSAQSDFRELVQ